MGIFDKLVKGGLNKVLGETVDQAAKDAADRLRAFGKSMGLDDAFSGEAENRPSQRYERRPVQPTGEKNDIRAMMPGLLRSDFADYAVQADVPASAFGWNVSPCRNYDYCLYRDGFLAAAILLTDHNRDNNMAFKNAKAALEAAGVPCVNFYTHMPNQRAYVVSRIKSFL